MAAFSDGLRVLDAAMVARYSDQTMLARCLLSVRMTTERTAK